MSETIADLELLPALSVIFVGYETSLHETRVLPTSQLEFFWVLVAAERENRTLRDIVLLRTNPSKVPLGRVVQT